MQRPVPEVRYRILANAQPKNGTHLLLSTLREVPGLRFSGVAVDWSDPDAAVERLQATHPGEFSKGHIPYLDPAPPALEDGTFVVFNMVRDPRDNAVSFYHYVLRYPEHYLYPAFAQMRDDGERLMAVIRGFSFAQGAGEVSMKTIGHRFDVWGGWDDSPSCLTLRFEDLVGERGGGSALRQQQAIRRMLQRLDIAPQPEIIASIARGGFDTSTHSFRKGVIGDWRNHFTRQHVETFKRVANHVLLRYGYEQDADWH